MPRKEDIAAFMPDPVLDKEWYAGNKVFTNVESDILKGAIEDRIHGKGAISGVQAGAYI